MTATNGKHQPRFSDVTDPDKAPMPVRRLLRMRAMAQQAASLVNDELDERETLERDWASAKTETEKLQGEKKELAQRVDGTRQALAASEARVKDLERELADMRARKATEPKAEANEVAKLRRQVADLETKLEATGAFCPHCGKRRVP